MGARPRLSEEMLIGPQGAVPQKATDRGASLLPESLAPRHPEHWIFRPQTDAEGGT